VSSTTGNLSSGSHPSAGDYTITNPGGSNTLTSCAIIATENDITGGPVIAEATAAHTITVFTYDDQFIQNDLAFSLIVSC
jgi:hypothetical protein